MKLVSALPILAALAMTGSAALAQEAPRVAPDVMAKHHAEMCTNHYANAVGKLAELEVRLALAPAQKSAFERWKQVKLTDAKVASAQCADMAPLGRDASIIEHHQRQIARLEARLANLKAETPALDALVKVLSPEQQLTLKRAGWEAMREHMGGMHRMMEGGHGPMMMRQKENHEHAN